MPTIDDIERLLRLGAIVVFVLLSLALVFGAYGFAVRAQKAPQNEASSNQLISQLTSPLDKLVALMTSMESSGNQDRLKQQELLNQLSSNFQQQTKTLESQSSGQLELAKTLTEISGKLDGLTLLREAIQLQATSTTAGLDSTRAELSAQLLANTTAITLMHSELLRVLDVLINALSKRVESIGIASLENQNRIEAAAIRRIDGVEDKIISQPEELKKVITAAVQDVIAEVTKVFPILEQIFVVINKPGESESLALMRDVVNSQTEILNAIQRIIKILDTSKPSEIVPPTTTQEPPNDPVA